MPSFVPKTPVRMQVGKIRSTGSKHAWEPGYVDAINSQMRQLEDLVNQIVRSLGESAPLVAYNALVPTINKATNVYCPIDTGELRASAYLEIVPNRTRPVVEIGFARGGTPVYAVIVHENLIFHHEPPTRAKFLEEAVYEDIGDIGDRLIAGMQAVWASGEQG